MGIFCKIAAMLGFGSTDKNEQESSPAEPEGKAAESEQQSQQKTETVKPMVSSIKKYVLIGAGPASVRAAETLRKADGKCIITMIGLEKEVPYSRMALPYYLSGMIEDTGTHLRKTDNHFESLNIVHILSLIHISEPTRPY